LVVEYVEPSLVEVVEYVEPSPAKEVHLAEYL